MPNVRSHFLDGKEVWQGRSALSGFRTRLFLKEEDALAEEAWLDNEWRKIENHYRHQSDLHERHFKNCLQEAMRAIVRLTGKGCFELHIRPRHEEWPDDVFVLDTTALDEPFFLPGLIIMQGSGDDAVPIAVTERTIEALDDLFNQSQPRWTSAQGR